MNKQHIEVDYLAMSKNFITPIVLDYEITNDYRVVEFSAGTDFNDNEIWAVSEFTPDMNTTKRGNLFTNKEEAYKYYLLLKN